MLKIETEKGELVGDINGTLHEILADVMTVISWTYEILSQDIENFMPLDEYVEIFKKFALRRNKSEDITVC